MREERKIMQDRLTAASSAVATVIALNKPIYPLYVWWFAPDAFKPALLTMILFPAYAAIPFVARRHSLAARTMMIAAGTLDTLMITKVMGEASGAWLFLAACIMLSAVSFYETERWHARLSTAVIFLLFSGLYHRYRTPWIAISQSDLQTLFTLNAVGAFSLFAFIALRFPGHKRFD